MPNPHRGDILLNDRQFVMASSDPFSALFRRVRVRAIVPRRSAFTSPWAVQVPGGMGGFYASVRGRMHITLPAEAPVALGEGDIAVLFRGFDHTVGDPPGTPPRRPEELLDRREMRERRGILQLKGEATSVHFVGGILEMDGVGRDVLDHLPPLVVLRTNSYPRPSPLARCLDLLESAEHLDQTREAVTDLAATMIMVAAIDQALSHLRVESPGQLALLRDASIGPVIKLLRDHPERPWSMKSLAEEAGLSRSMFHERFVSLIGVAPMSFLRRLRLEHGRQLLALGGDPASVARRSGYGSAAAFAAAHRREYGAAPPKGAQTPEAAPPHSDR